MKTATITTLKAKLSEHIALVKRGEEVIVTERGKPVARIVPITPSETEDERRRDLIARGVIRPGKGGFRELLAQPPVVRLPAGTIQRWIDEEREERY
jgi:prevent-host-death family protein